MKDKSKINLIFLIYVFSFREKSPPPSRNRHCRVTRQKYNVKSTFEDGERGLHRK